MSTSEKKRSILGVLAHADDLELMAGGTIAKWAKEGHKIHVMTFTDGVWESSNGEIMRNKEEALEEEKEVAKYLGYTVENLGYHATNLDFKDKHVLEVLHRINKHNVDTLICPWEYDNNYDHQIASKIALTASGRVPRILMGQINYYLREFFTPNFFVDISDTWEQKMGALKHYKSEWKRLGSDWCEFLDATTTYYGKMSGAKRAEGFITHKFLED